jgi:hypothetical protein
MATLGGSTGDDEQDMEGRQSLVEHCLPALFDAYDQAQTDGILDPVIFLIDCEDPIGGEIARQWEGDDGVDVAILANADDSPADSEGEGPTTTLVRAFPFADCQHDIPEVFPYLSGSFAAPPSEGFLIVVVSFGGAATLNAPATRPDER